MAYVRAGTGSQERKGAVRHEIRRQRFLRQFTDQNSKLRRTATSYTAKKIVWMIFKLVLLSGLSFVILFPFLVKLSSAFMSRADIYDNTVGFIPKHPTLQNIEYIWKQTPFLEAVIGSFLLSLMVAVCSVIMAALVGYGLAKFRFKGVGLVIALVIFTLLVPPATVMVPMYIRFRYFDIFGILQAITGSAVKLTDTPVPLLFLSLTGLGFRGGLYIMVMRQVFCGIPNELSEAAAVDGLGTFRTFTRIMLPLSKSMLTVIFLFSFSWQWTDTFYASTLYNKIKLLPNIITLVKSYNTTNLGTGTYATGLLVNTVAIMAILPLLIMFVFTQRKFVQGIERSGIVG